MFESTVDRVAMWRSAKPLRLDRTQHSGPNIKGIKVNKRSLYYSTLWYNIYNVVDRYIHDCSLTIEWFDDFRFCRISSSHKQL